MIVLMGVGRSGGLGFKRSVVKSNLNYTRACFLLYIFRQNTNFFLFLFFFFLLFFFFSSPLGASMGFSSTNSRSSMLPHFLSFPVLPLLICNFRNLLIEYHHSCLNLLLCLLCLLAFSLFDGIPHPKILAYFCFLNTFLLVFFLFFLLSFFLFFLSFPPLFSFPCSLSFLFLVHE